MKPVAHDQETNLEDGFSGENRQKQINTEISFPLQRGKGKQI